MHFIYFAILSQLFIILSPSETYHFCLPQALVNIIDIIGHKIIVKNIGAYIYSKFKHTTYAHPIGAYLQVNARNPCS
ncbi:hypothetical protein SRRS_24420 [Sporomusa rhizae]